MEHNSMLLPAAAVALAGLVILFLVRPEGDEGFRLQGRVIEDHGSRSIVQTNVTLIAKDVKRGDTVDTAVFWSDNAFVAVPSRKG